MTDPITLAARVEALTGPCRDTQAAVMRAFGWKPYNGPQKLLEGYWVNPLTGMATDLPDPLTSLDAAMTLVPEGWNWGVGVDSIVKGPTGWAWVCPDDGDYQLERAATPALALTAAALRARESSK